MSYDYGDTERILSITEDTYKKFKHKRMNHERIWYRNLLYLLGNQWIRWDDFEHRWRKRRLANWVPTPVTNRFSSSGERLVSILSKIEPNWTFVPASDREEDITAASIADKIEELICEENEIDVVREEIARWLVYTGNAFLFSWAEDITPQTPMQELTDTGVMSQPPPPEYKLYTDILSPFEVYADMSIKRIKDQERIILVSRKDKEWVRKTYGVDAEESEPEDLGIRYLESIGYTTEAIEGAEVQSGRDQKIPRVTIKRLLIQPSDDWPEGLYAVTCNDKLADSRPLPKALDGKPYLPITQFGFDPVPGSFFCRTPLNDVAQKQTQRNKLESMIELITLRMSSPIWLMPEGTTVKGFSGEPGAILKYSMMGDKASKPDRIPGEQIPSTVMNWLEQIDKDIEELCATFEALKGQAPYSGAPGVVVDQLIEQGLSRFGPALRSIAEGYRQWMKIQIELFRTYATTPRTLASLGDNSKWKISNFSQADIQGAVNVRIEADSTVPRSNQVDAARTLAAINSQLIDISDPLIRLKVLKKLQLGDLMESLNDEMLSAIRENEAIQMGQIPAVKPFIDNHEIHIKKHKSFANSEEGLMFMEPLIQHITEHNMYMDAEMNPGMAPPQEGMQGQPDTQGEEAALNPGGQV